MKAFVIAKYETLSDLNSWVALAFLIILPLIFTGTIVLLLPKGDQSRLIFLVTGTMNTYMLMYAGMNATLTLIERRQSGVLRRIFILPVSKLEFLVGKSLGILGQVAVQVVIMVVLLLLFGLKMSGSWLAFLVVMLLLMLFAIVLGLLVSTLARSLTVALLIMMAIINPLVLLSGTWLPASYLQDNLGNIVQANPLYQALHALSEIAVNGAGLIDVMPELAVVLTYILVLGGLTVYLYEKRVTA
ncbi:MAG TPA: ABC transporter permease [Anaerolineales bacterium]|nr:ABC transporter permease [Anaerolineales bacterium]